MLTHTGPWAFYFIWPCLKTAAIPPASVGPFTFNCHDRGPPPPPRIAPHMGHPSVRHGASAGPASRVDSESRFAIFLRGCMPNENCFSRKYHCESREAREPGKKVKMCYFVKLANFTQASKYEICRKKLTILFYTDVGCLPQLDRF